MFPKQFREHPPQNLDEVYEKIDQSRKEHIDYLVGDEIMPIVFNRVYQDGYDLGSEECINSTILLVEAFKSAMSQSVGQYHPLQELSDNMQFSAPTEDTPNNESQLTKEEELDNSGL